MVEQVDIIIIIMEIVCIMLVVGVEIVILIVIFIQIITIHVLWLPPLHHYRITIIIKIILIMKNIRQQPIILTQTTLA